MAMAPEPFYVPTEAEVERPRTPMPGLARALELYRLDLRTEATREWLFAIRGMDDTQLLAAAELARRAEVYDRAINTADRTVHLHNFSVRYLAPYREVFGEYARAAGLEEAWVLGAGAPGKPLHRRRASPRPARRGLMQVMPRDRALGRASTIG